MNRLAIIQARTGSTRLPGKVLERIGRHSMLERVICRVQRARTVDKAVVATSDLDADDPIAEACAAFGVETYRGSETDVLDRFMGAARTFGATVVVRITADCPLIDADVVDRVVDAFNREPAVDFCSNTLVRTYPRGLDVEVMSIGALERAWQNAHEQYERAHVCPYVYGHPELFQLRNVESGFALGHWRWTVDTPADLAFVRAVYEKVDPLAPWLQIVELLRSNPHLPAINAGSVQKPTVEG